MKKVLGMGFVMLALALLLLAMPTQALADDGPSDCQYAVAAYTGLAPDQVAVSQQAFDTKIGFQWGLTGAGWAGTYASRCNLYGHSVGLTANILYEDGVTNSGTLTRVGKILSDIGKAEYPVTTPVTTTSK